MITGFYSSAAGMLGQIEQQDAISNNLANVNTPGYKRTHVGFSAFSAELAAAGRSNSAAPLQQTPCVIPIPFAEQDLSQGLIQDTADPANFAIDGPGYFVVSGPSGQQLTRSGSFRLDSSGRLVTMEGRAVLGRNGPIQIASADWSVDSGGNVQVNGLVVDALRIEPGLNGRAASGASQRGNVIQGRLESSNVSVVKEMVLMLTALRAYEANQRTIQAFDQTLDKIINLPGRNA